MNPKTKTTKEAEMAVTWTVAAAQNSRSREKWQGNAMHQLLSTKHVYVETERVNIFLNETSIINFFTFKGVITDFLPLVAAQVFIVTRHPDCHMFTVHMTFEHFCPDLKFCEGRGGEDKPFSNHTILLLVLVKQNLILPSQPILALCLLMSDRTWSSYQ